MKISDELFQLIRSLTRSEKRYFKLFTSIQGGEKNYLRLFDAIDAQTEYDEAAIRARFAGERFTRQLNVAKKYLYDLILRSLRVYHTEYAAQAKARDLVKSAEILFEKGLTAQARRMVEKAIGLAGDHESIMPLVDALAWRSRIQFGRHVSEAAIAEHFDALDEKVGRLRSEMEHERMLSMAYAAVCTNAEHAEEGRAILERWRTHPLAPDQEEALTVRARSMYHFIMILDHFQRRDYSTARELARRQIELIESKPEYLAEYAEHYITALTNLMLLQRLTHDMDGFWDSVERLRRSERTLLAGSRLRTPRIRHLLFASVYLNLLCLALETGSYEEAAGYVDVLQSGLDSQPEYLDDYTRVQFAYHAAWAFVGIGDYRRALDFGNRAIAASSSDNFREMYRCSRLITIIIHYELGNMELLPHLVNSVHRDARLRGSLNEAECMLLSLFRKLPRACTRSQLDDAFTVARDYLAAHRCDPDKAGLFSSFPFIEWLESKLTGQRLGDLLRERSEIVPSPQKHAV